MLFEPKHYGKPISKKLSEILRRNTSAYDYTKAAECVDYNIGVSTIRDVTLGRNPLTKGNAEAIIFLARIAFMNARTTIKIAEEDQDYFLEELGEDQSEITSKVKGLILK